MTSLFAARRKPKRIVRPDDDTHPRDVNQNEEEEEDTGPVVRRPTTTLQKARSKLRVSFNPDDATETNSEDSSKPKDVESDPDSRQKSKTALAKKRTALDLLADRRERDEGHGDAGRPSYSKAYLDELRNSTPSTPRDLSTYGTPVEEIEIDALDVAGKFGSSTAGSSSQNIIPSIAEIREKKERRARLAKEQAAATLGGHSEDFISLDDYNSDGEFKPRRMQLSTYVQKERASEDTRLIRDDEDIMEGFDEFVEDTGKVTLGRRGLKEQSRKEREHIRELINQAEGGGGSDSGEDSDEDDSEVERRHAYEEAQTHHGMAGRAKRNRDSKRPMQPREITPIPRPGKSLQRLRELIQKVEFERAQAVKRSADLEKERLEVIASQAHIQKSLEEAGRELERLQQQFSQNNGTSAAPANTERGLESLATITSGAESHLDP